MEKSFQKQVFNLITNLTGQENVLAIPKDFIKYAGSADAGLFLSQLIYWCDKGKRKDGYIYKTYKNWKNELGLTEYKVRKARKNLEGKGILKTKVKKANGNPTVHYKLLKNAFITSFLKFQQKENEINTKGNLKSINSLTETTTKITDTENTSNQIYVELPFHEHVFLQIYNKHFKNKFSKNHMKVKRENLNNIIWGAGELYNSNGPEWYKEVVNYHFSNLPKNNDGNILYFLAIKERYIKGEYIL